MTLYIKIILAMKYIIRYSNNAKSIKGVFMATIKRPTGSYLNVYEEMHDKYMNNEWFDETRWQNAANRGNLAREVDILQRQDELGNYTDFSNKYHLDRADENVFYAAVSRELYADKDKVNEYTENVYNPETNKYEEKKYNMTEYDWLGHQLQNWVDYDNQMLEKAREAEARERNGFIDTLAKFGGGTLASIAEFAAGVAGNIENVANIFYGGISATGDAIFNGENWLEAYRDATDYDSQLESNLSRTIEAIDSWAYILDENGNYQGFMKYVAGTARALGEMAPSMVANMVLPGVGLSTKAAGQISMSGYYASMWSGRMTDRFVDPEFASVATADIVLESAIQSASDLLIEKGLQKLTGGSTLDRIMYGVVGRGSSAALNRLTKDFVSEGLEELLQDFAAGLESQLMGLKAEQFAQDGISAQALIDSFIIGGLSSVIMSGVDIIAGDRIKFGDTKLSKLKSWVFRSDINNIYQAYDNLLNDKSLTESERKRYVASANNSYMMIIDLMNGLGAERSAAAVNALKKISTYAKNKEMYVFEGNTSLSATINNRTNIEARYVKSLLNSANKLASDVAYESFKRALDKKTVKLRDSEKTSIQTVDQKIVDAQISKIHDFIDKANINEITETSNRSSKRVTLAKKLINEYGKNIAFTDGKNIVETDDVIMIPSHIADNMPDAETLRTIGENELIDNIAARLDRDILNKIRNEYRRTLKDKRNGSYIDSVRTILFNDDVFKQFVQNSDQEAYNFVAHLKDVLEAAKGNKVSDFVYRKIISDIIARQKPIIAEYVINQQYADLTEVLNLFTEKELSDIRKKRWSKDLANRVLNNKSFTKLTEADWRILESRINYLQIDKSLKDMIRKDIHSQSLSARTRALTILDNEYKNQFFSKYNDITYLTQTSPGNNLFNSLLQQYDLTLMNIRTDKYSKTFMNAIAEYNKTLSQNDVPYTNPFLFLQDKFSEYSQGAYSIKREGNRIIIDTNIIVDAYTENMVGYYNDSLGMMKEVQALEKGNIPLPTQDVKIMKNVISNLVDGSKVDKINLAYTTINDIVQNPFNYLRAEVLSDIRQDYKEVNNYTAFQYIREQLLQKYDTLSITRKSNGDIAFVSFTNAYDLLQPDIRSADKESNTIFEKYVDKGPIPLKTFVNYGNNPFLDDYKVIFIRDSKASAGNHNPYNHTITVNLAKNNAFTKYVILHEYTHAVQYENGFAGGMTPYFEVSDQLIADFEKHLPQFLEGVTDKKTKQLRIQWFIYKTASGEVDANMWGDTITFMSTLVKDKNPMMAKIVLPWGTEYDILFNDKSNENLEIPVFNSSEVITTAGKDVAPEYYNAYEDYKQKVANKEIKAIDKQYIPHEGKTKEIFGIKEIYEYWHQPLGSGFINHNVKSDVIKVITPEVKDKMLHLAHMQLLPNISYEEFINMDIPFVRKQNIKDVYQDEFLSVSLGEQGFARNNEFAQSDLGVSLFVGTIKPKDLIGYIPDTLREGLVPASVVKKSQRIDVVGINGKFYVYDTSLNELKFKIYDEITFDNEVLNSLEYYNKIEFENNNELIEAFNEMDDDNELIISSNMNAYVCAITDLNAYRKLYKNGFITLNHAGIVSVNVNVGDMISRRQITVLETLFDSLDDLTSLVIYDVNNEPTTIYKKSDIMDLFTSVKQENIINADDIFSLGPIIRDNVPVENHRGYKELINSFKAKCEKYNIGSVNALDKLINNSNEITFLITLNGDIFYDNDVYGLTDDPYYPFIITVAYDSVAGNAFKNRIMIDSYKYMSKKQYDTLVNFVDDLDKIKVDMTEKIKSKLSKIDRIRHLLFSTIVSNKRPSAKEFTKKKKKDSALFVLSTGEVLEDDNPNEFIDLANVNNVGDELLYARYIGDELHIIVDKLATNEQLRTLASELKSTYNGKATVFFFFFGEIVEIQTQDLYKGLKDAIRNYNNSISKYYSKLKYSCNLLDFDNVEVENSDEFKQLVDLVKKKNDDFLAARAREIETFQLFDDNTGKFVSLINEEHFKPYYEKAKNLDSLPIYEMNEDTQSYYYEIMNDENISEYYSYSVGHEAIPETIREDFVNYIKKHRDLQVAMLHVAHEKILPNVSFREFLNTDIPFIRLQNNEHIYESSGLSVTLGEEAFDTLMTYVSPNMVQYLFVGTIKPKDLIAYLPDSLSEALLPSKAFKNANVYRIVNTNGQFPHIASDATANDKIYASDWYDKKIHVGVQNKTDIEKYFVDFDKRLSDLLQQGQIGTYTGILNKDDTLFILPNGNTYVANNREQLNEIYNTRADVTYAAPEYVKDSLTSRGIVQIECYSNNVECVLPKQFTTNQFNTLSRLFKEQLKNGKNVGFATDDQSDIVRLKSSDNISVVMKNTIDDYNSKINKKDVRNKAIEVLDVDNPDTTIVQQERTYRVRQSKRGAKARANSERTYVSVADAKGTNLQPFIGRHIAKDMQGFIKEASQTKLPAELWDKIVDGTINYYDIDKYFRRNQDIDDYTFSLIRKWFFPDSYFKTNEELEKFTNIDLRLFYALAGVLHEKKLDEDITKPLSKDKFDALYKQLLANKKFSDRLLTKVEHAFDVKVFNPSTKKYEWTALNIDENHLRTVAMRLMDGSIESASHIIAIARAIALSYRYGEVWNTADLKKDVSLQSATKGHKADDAESGTLEDITADVSTSRDMIDQIYDQRVSESPILQKRQELVVYYGDIYRKKHPELANASRRQQEVIFKKIVSQVNAMSAEKVDTKYKKILMKKDGINIKDSTVNNDKYMPPKNLRKNLVTRIKSLATTCKNWMSTNQWKRLPERYKKYFDENGNLKKEFYFKVDLKDTNGQYPALQEVRDDLFELSRGLRHGVFTTKASTKAFEDSLKFKERYQKEKAKNEKIKMKSILTDTRKDVLVESNIREFKVTADISIPVKLQKMLEIQFDKFRKSTMQFIANDKDIRQRTNAKQFYADNAEILSNLTSDDVEQIITFYENSVLLDATNQDVIKYRVFEIYTLVYIMDEARSGRWNIDSDYLELVEDILKTKVAGSASVLAAWRAVIHKANPNKTISEKFATRLGVQPAEEDIDNLSDAVKTGDVKLIQKAHQRMAANILTKYNKKGGASNMDKVITFQKAMMLSGPNTMLRNQLSNIFLHYGNKLADVLGHFTSKFVTKGDEFVRQILNKSPHTYSNQIDLAKVNVTSDVESFIKRECIDSGIMALIEDRLSKYDSRKNVTYTGVDQIVNMIVNGMINDIAQNNTYNHKIFNNIITTIFKWQSDRKYIDKAAKGYLGKLLTVQKVDLSRGLSEDVMEYISEAYRLAAFDYMHKTNVITELESKLRERAPKIYAGYKMVFPFMPTAWNWFVESLNWSPVGLVGNIVRLCKLEKTIDRIENDRMKGRQTVDPRLVKYLTERNVGKGIIGSFLLGLGMILGALGRIEVDDDDDKLKLKIGDIYFDISSVFGTTSILVGAELMNPRSGDIVQVMESAFGTLTEDAWFSDIAGMFGYGNETVWDVLMDQPTDIVGSFVPNLLKSINKLFYDFDVKYDSGFLGNLEYLAVSSIPFLAYAFPKKIDPFTGQVQSRYGLPFIADFLVDLVNIASPVRVKPHYVSDVEKIAIELGLNKQALKGVYNDIGKVDYTMLNTKYGELNNEALNDLINNKVKYSVRNDDNEYEDLYWRQMSETQKKTVIERIMSNNSQYAKIYTWTQAGHKYYGTNAMWETLKQLGITKNVFKGDKGFVA